MVGDEHERSLAVGGVDTARGVREHERVDAQPAEYPHAEDDPVGRVPLVEMRPSAQQKEREARERSDDQRARVPDCGGGRPAGDLAIGDLDRVVELFRERAQSAAEHDGELRAERRSIADRLRRPVELGDDAHAVPSARRNS